MHWARCIREGWDVTKQILFWSELRYEAQVHYAMFTYGENLLLWKYKKASYLTSDGNFIDFIVYFWSYSQFFPYFQVGKCNFFSGTSYRRVYWKYPPSRSFLQYSLLLLEQGFKVTIIPFDRFKPTNFLPFSTDQNYYYSMLFHEQSVYVCTSPSTCSSVLQHVYKPLYVH